MQRTLTAKYQLVLPIEHIGIRIGVVSGSYITPVLYMS